MKRIYLDHAATTPLHQEVAEVMHKLSQDLIGNPSSLHSSGRAAKNLLDESREVISGAFGCLFAEVVFTGSGTESVNQAVIGSALANKGHRKKILLGAGDHHCSLHLVPQLKRLGFEVELLPVDRNGFHSVESVKEFLSDEVLLVSLLSANNELGTIQPIAEIGEVTKECGALFHVDAVQTYPLEKKVDELKADFVSVSAHKFYGPKGVGALYVRGGVKVQPLLVGGVQERELRAGTENVVGIAGMAKACQSMIQDGELIKKQARASRDEFVKQLPDECVLTVDGVETLTSHAHLRVPGIDAQTLLIRLDQMGVDASSGAACSSGSLEPSHVLLACGYSEKEALEGMRFTFGMGSTKREAMKAAEVLIGCVQEIKSQRS